MLIADFTARHVPGLYSFDHFEHPSGAFIQRSHSLPVHWMYRDPEGKMTEHHTLESLRAAVEGTTE